MGNSGDHELFLRRLLTGLALAALILLLWQLAELWLLAFGAILVAIILRVIASPLERRFAWSSHWALAAASALIVIAFALVIWLAGHAVSDQLDGLNRQLPQALNRIKSWLNESRIGARLDNWIEHSNGIGMLAALPGATVSIIGGMVDFGLVLFIAVYLALQPELYRQGFAKLLPEAARKEFLYLLDNCGRALRLWMKGQLIAMAVIGVLITIGLWLVGIPSALALGLIAGVAEFIPIAGLLFATLLSLLLAFAKGTDAVLWTFVVFAVVQQVESNIIVPLVEQQVVMLPRALTLLSLMGFALLFGPFSLLVAIPVTVAGFVAVRQLYMRDTLGEAAAVPGERA